jgi:hypothetical protein
VKVIIVIHILCIEYVVIGLTLADLIGREDSGIGFKLTDAASFSTVSAVNSYHFH